jgi:hypothetical protein
MKTYRQELVELFYRVLGTRDIASANYVELNKDMDKDSFDNEFTIGNINLIEGNILYPNENEDIVGKFISTPLP